MKGGHHMSRIEAFDWNLRAVPFVCAAGNPLEAAAGRPRHRRRLTRRHLRASARRRVSTRQIVPARSGPGFRASRTQPPTNPTGCRHRAAPTQRNHPCTTSIHTWPSSWSTTGWTTCAGQPLNRASAARHAIDNDIVSAASGAQPRRNRSCIRHLPATWRSSTSTPASRACAGRRANPACDTRSTDPPTRQGRR